MRATINSCHKTIGRLVLANTTGSFALLRSKLNELFNSTVKWADQINAAHLNPRLAGEDKHERYKNELGQHLAPEETGARRVGSVALRAEGRTP